MTTVPQGPLQTFQQEFLNFGIFPDGHRTLPKIWVCTNFGSELRVIGDRSSFRVLATWSQKTWKFVEEFLRFFCKNDLLRKNFQGSSVSKIFTASPWTLLCSNFVKCWHVADENRRNHALFTRPKNNISPASQTVATKRIAAKICQGQPPAMYSQCSRYLPNRFTFGEVIAERVDMITSPNSL